MNYLLDRLGESAGSDQPTVGIMDLGGGSTQIVFEPDALPNEVADLEKDLTAVLDDPSKYTFKYDGRVYHLFQHSFLGYGLNEARKSVKNSVVAAFQRGLAHLPGKLTRGKPRNPIDHPCLAPGYRESFEHDPRDPAIPARHRSAVSAADVLTVSEGVTGGTTSTHPLRGSSTTFDACHAVVRDILQLPETCAADAASLRKAWCAMSGIAMPSLLSHFANRDLYAFSYFWDLTRPTRASELAVVALKDRAQWACSSGAEASRMDAPERDAWRDALKENPHLCLDLTFLYALLADGYGMEADRRLTITQKIGGIETGWTLGATIAMLDADGEVREQA